MPKRRGRRVSAQSAARVAVGQTIVFRGLPPLADDISRFVCPTEAPLSEQCCG
jgi:hypothetical protein